MAKGSTKPGYGPPTDDVTNTAPTDTEPFDPTTLRDVRVEAGEEQLVARYRTDPRLAVSPEMDLLRGISADKKKRGIQGFRDGLEDAKAVDVVRAHRDEALQRLADETAANVVARKRATPTDEPPEPKPVATPIPVARLTPLQRLLIVAALVVLTGVIIFAIVGRLAKPVVEPVSVPSPSTPVVPPVHEAATPPPAPTPVPVPSPTPAPSTTTSATHDKPKPHPSAPEPTKKPSVPSPSATVFDPMQGT